MVMRVQPGPVGLHRPRQTASYIGVPPAVPVATKITASAQQTHLPGIANIDDLRTTKMDQFHFAPKHQIPLLEEMIHLLLPLPDCGPYNRLAFVAYLARHHCMENLDFIVELDRLVPILQQADNSAEFSTENIRRQDALLRHWRVLYSVFLEEDAMKEVNVPCALRASLGPESLPPMALLARLRSNIYDILVDRYNDFVLVTRQLSSDAAVRRRRLEAVPPELADPNFGPSPPSYFLLPVLPPRPTRQRLLPAGAEPRPYNLGPGPSAAPENGPTAHDLDLLPWPVPGRTRELMPELTAGSFRRAYSSGSEANSSRANSKSSDGSSLRSSLALLVDLGVKKAVRRLRSRRASDL